MRPPKKRFLIGGCLLLIAVVAVLGAVFGRGKFRDFDRFPTAAYLEAPANLQGNKYVLDAWIESQLHWREEVGRLVEVRPASGQEKVAVFVPAALEQNLYVGQRYHMKVSVRRGGLLHVQDLQKY